MKTNIALFALVFITFRSIAQYPVEFDSIPAWGTPSPQTVTGKVTNVDPAAYYVAVYIFVEEAGGFYIKPTNAAPKTMIQPTLTWSCLITTGGLDRYATKIFAVLLPMNTNPPLINGGEIPDTLLNYPRCIASRPHGDKKITWAGHTWTIKRSVSDLPIGPGSNRFSDSDSIVYVDAQNNLHLKIVKSGTNWYCSELIGDTSFGYGTYTYETLGRTDTLTWKTAGIFTWDDISKYVPVNPTPDWREIDIEHSKWGDPGSATNTQYVIQPFTVPENLHRFHMDLTDTSLAVHSFCWMPGRVIFNSHWGNSAETCDISNSYVPVPGDENIRINLWKNSNEEKDYHAGFVLKSFSFLPNKILNLKLLLEGLYNGGGILNEAQGSAGSRWGPGIADRVNILLLGGMNYHDTVFQSPPMNLTTAGEVTGIHVPAVFSADYYICVSHRNSITTASSQPVSFAGNTITYDFTDSASKALGENQKDGGDGHFMFWCGDVNQDGIVDSGDMNPVDNASTQVTMGYVAEDINGDGIVDSGDMNFVDNNSTGIVIAVVP